MVGPPLHHFTCIIFRPLSLTKVVVAVNKFFTDTPAEIEMVKAAALAAGADAAVMADHWAKVTNTGETRVKKGYRNGMKRGYEKGDEKGDEKRILRGCARQVRALLRVPIACYVCFACFCVFRVFLPVRQGGEGARELGEAVVKVCDEQRAEVADGRSEGFKFLYPLDSTIKDKIRVHARSALSPVGLLAVAGESALSPRPASAEHDPAPHLDLDPFH